MQTLPQVINSLKDIKHAVPNSQTWPAKEVLQKMEYKEKVKVLQDILMSTMTEISKLNVEADANLNKIDKDARKGEEIMRQKLEKEQEKLRTKTQEHNDLAANFNSFKQSKIKVEENMKHESERLARTKNKLMTQLDSKDKQIAEYQAELQSLKEENTKENKNVSMLLLWTIAAIHFFIIMYFEHIGCYFNIY